MKKRLFKCKTEYFQIEGMYNIPGTIMLSGHGYQFKTYCCNTCGELFVVDLSNAPIDIKSRCINKFCPTCNSDLATCLVGYPENIFYEGKILINNNPIDTLCFDKTELKEMYVLG